MNGRMLVQNQRIHVNRLNKVRNTSSRPIAPPSPPPPPQKKKKEEEKKNNRKKNVCIKKNIVIVNDKYSACKKAACDTINFEVMQ